MMSCLFGVLAVMNFCPSELFCVVEQTQIELFKSEQVHIISGLSQSYV